MSKALVGNSSCGIAEAPSLNLSVVNIGDRQSGREKMNNIIDVNYDKNEIKKAIKKAINMKENIDLNKMPYYMDGAEEKIVDILNKIEINEKLLKKRWIL
jgi:UDP-N-acetylglucosamine 2-epimerase